MSRMATKEKGKTGREGGGGRPAAAVGTILWKGVCIAARAVFRVVSVMAFILFLLAFTPAPYKVYAWLANPGTTPATPPEYIVVLSGGGIPSESGLMRTYFAAMAAARYPKARVVVCAPGVLGDTNSTPAGMSRELTLRGVAYSRMLFEDKGVHTLTQAENTFHMLSRPGGRTPQILVVTSPEHMRRALASFRKAGFAQPAGLSAFSESIEADLTIPEKDGGGLPAADIGRSTFVRYRFWSNLRYEIDSLRELAALGYYRLKGWI